MAATRRVDRGGGWRTGVGAGDNRVGAASGIGADAADCSPTPRPWTLRVLPPLADAATSTGSSAGGARVLIRQAAAAMPAPATRTAATSSSRFPPRAGREHPSVSSFSSPRRRGLRRPETPCAAPRGAPPTERAPGAAWRSSGAGVDAPAACSAGDVLTTAPPRPARRVHDAPRGPAGRASPRGCCSTAAASRPGMSSRSHITKATRRSCGRAESASRIRIMSCCCSTDSSGRPAGEPAPSPGGRMPTDAEPRRAHTVG